MLNHLLIATFMLATGAAAPAAAPAPSALPEIPVARFSA